MIPSFFFTGFGTLSISAPLIRIQALVGGRQNAFIVSPACESSESPSLTALDMNSSACWDVRVLISSEKAIPQSGANCTREKEKGVSKGEDFSSIFLVKLLYIKRKKGVLERQREDSVCIFLVKVLHSHTETKERQKRE